MIKFNVVVKNRIAQFKNTIVPVSHNEGYIVNFTMDEEWTGLITAVLVYEDGTVITPRILNENNEIELPALKTGMLYAGLVSGDVKTTTPARINIAKSIKDIPEGEIIPDPEAPIYNQIIEKINQVANSVTRLDGKLVLAVDELKLRDFNLDQKVESYRNEYNQYYISLSEDIDEILNDLYNLKRDTYNKEYIDGVINGINENIEDIDADIENLKRKTNQLDNDKADKENTYTKDEVDQKIDDIPVYDDTEIKKDVTVLKGDLTQLDDKLSALDVYDLQLVKETTGFNIIYDDKIVFEHTGGTWKYKDVLVSNDVTEKITLIVNSIVLDENGYGLRVYNADKTKDFGLVIKEAGVYLIDLTGYVGLSLRLQASTSASIPSGTVCADVTVWTGDISEHKQGLPDYFTGLDVVKSEIDSIKNANSFSVKGVDIFRDYVEEFKGKYLSYNTTYNFVSLNANAAYDTYFIKTENLLYEATFNDAELPRRKIRFAIPLKSTDIINNRLDFIGSLQTDIVEIDNTELKAPCYAITVYSSTGTENIHIREKGYSEEVHYGSGTWQFEKVLNKPNLHCYLPKEIYVAVGRTIELYNNLVCLEANKYHLDWTCAIGTDYARKWSVTGVSSKVGSYPLTLTIYDDNLDVVKTLTSTVKVVNDSISENNKIVPIGDSLTNIKPWLSEVQTLSGGKITYIGTRGRPTDDYSHEGRSGATAEWYTKDSTYSFDTNYVGVTSVAGNKNPFWNGTKFSLNYYVTSQSDKIGTPNAVQLLLGTNGIEVDPTKNANNIKVLVDSIVAERPNMKIFVCNTLYRSNQNGYYSTGADGYATGQSDFQYSADVKVMNLQNRLAELFADYTNVCIVPLSVCMDREYNFGQKEVAINPRSTIKEMIPLESVHPQNSGYMQMADVMFSAYCAVL